MLHDTLWQENAEIAVACLRHPFVRGLAEGSLDSVIFRRYVAQDAFFLHAFARAYALAAARNRHRVEPAPVHATMPAVLVASAAGTGQVVLRGLGEKFEFVVRVHRKGI